MHFLTRGNGIDLIDFMNKVFSTQSVDVTIIVVTFGRRMLLEKMLTSYFVAKAEAEKRSQLSFELRMMLNGNDPDSEKLLLGYGPFEKVDKPATPAAARNMLMKKINSPWVFFMDDDIYIEPEFFLKFKELSDEYPEIDVWGGPNTTPHKSSYQQLRNGWILSSWLITGPVAQRYALKGKSFSRGGQFNLTLCNLFIKNKTLNNAEFLPFLKTAEENELIYSLKEKGCQLAFSDDLSVAHERRGSARKFLKQIFYYGYGRGQLFFKVPILKQLIFVFIPIVAALGVVTAVYLPWLLVIWILSINLHYSIKFKKIDPLMFVLPILVWLFYLAGLTKGSVASFQRFKMEFAQ
jgi:glycosyltransferase involved in cell wall biosynthesis